MTLEQRILKKIADRLDRSIKLNFQKGGRPEKWKQSKRAEGKNKSKIDGKMRTGKTLIDTATLRNSIITKVVGSEVIAGTSIIYAAIHNFGGRIQKTVTVKEHERTIKQAFGKPIEEREIKVKSHKRNMNLIMPKREFMMIQKEDIEAFKRIIKKEMQNEFNV